MMDIPRACYGLLLRLYPRAFREMFADDMVQTFADLHHEARQSGGLALVIFLAAFVVDDLRNILAQHHAELVRARAAGTIPTGQILLASLLALPCCLICTGLSVSLALALPHPPLSGVFVLVALALVLVIGPVIVGGMVSWRLANVALQVLGRTSARMAPTG